MCHQLLLLKHLHQLHSGKINLKIANMKKLLTLALLSTAFLACTDDDIRSEHSLASGPKIVGFNSSLVTVSYFEDLGPIEREFPVNLIGLGNGQTSDSDIVVSYEIDMAASTAEEGVEFDLVDTSGTLTIPAGSTFGVFPIIVNSGNLDEFQKTQLVINLTTASSGSVVGQQYRTLRITFVGCQSIISPGSYTATISQPAGFVTRTNEIITELSTNNFKTRYTGTYALGSTAAPADQQGFFFEDICSEINVPNQNLFNFYSNEVFGYSDDGVDGTVSDSNNLVIRYEITFAAGNVQYQHLLVKN